MEMYDGNTNKQRADRPMSTCWKPLLMSGPSVVLSRMGRGNRGGSDLGGDVWMAVNGRDRSPCGLSMDRVSMNDKRK